MSVTEDTFQSLVLADADGRWEIHRGRLREKPSMSVGHNRGARMLQYQLIRQISEREYEVFYNGGHLRAIDGATYVPDIVIVPTRMVDRLHREPRRFEVYDEPVPFVAEFWSPGTGAYDIDTKFPAYMLRGDTEIWRVHPFARTVNIWRRQPDGSHDEQIVTGGAVQLWALPAVTVEIEPLFVAEDLVPGSAY